MKYVYSHAEQAKQVLLLLCSVLSSGDATHKVNGFAVRFMCETHMENHKGV